MLRTSRNRYGNWHRWCILRWRRLPIQRKLLPLSDSDEKVVNSSSPGSKNKGFGLWVVHSKGEVTNNFALGKYAQREPHTDFNFGVAVRSHRFVLSSNLPHHLRHPLIQCQRTVAVIKIYTTAWGMWPLQNCTAAEYRLSGFCGSGILLS